MAWRGRKNTKNMLKPVVCLQAFSVGWQEWVGSCPAVFCARLHWGRLQSHRFTRARSRGSGPVWRLPQGTETVGGVWGTVVIHLFHTLHADQLSCLFPCMKIIMQVMQNKTKTKANKQNKQKTVLSFSVWKSSFKSMWWWVCIPEAIHGKHCPVFDLILETIVMWPLLLTKGNKGSVLVILKCSQGGLIWYKF